MSSKIAIIGAGPAGLSLGSLLHKNSIPYTIYDLRSQPHPSDKEVPSGSLDLHAESGLLTLEACGLLSSFKSISTECTEEMILTDKHCVIKHRNEGDGGRPEISRNRLTELLLSSIPPESIRWEHKLVSISPSSASLWTLSFQDKPDEAFDLVIGADGAWSRIRPALTDVRPHFSGVNCITLTATNITAKHPHLAAMVGGGSYGASGEKKAVMSQRGSLDSARIYLMISSSSESWISDSGLDKLGAAALKDRLLADPEMFGSWGPGVKELIAASCDDEALRGDAIYAKPLYMLEPGHRWEHKEGVTLVGDAAHLMTPFAGEGVNAAMLDTLQLAQEIIAAWGKNGALADAAKKYEDAMLERAKENGEETWRNLNMIFTDDAPRPIVEFFEKAFGTYSESAKR